jgi:hypothetical protein
MAVNPLAPAPMIATFMVDYYKINLEKQHSSVDKNVDTCI